MLDTTLRGHGLLSTSVNKSVHQKLAAFQRRVLSASRFAPCKRCVQISAVREDKAEQANQQASELRFGKESDASQLDTSRGDPELQSFTPEVVEADAPLKRSWLDTVTSKSTTRLLGILGLAAFGGGILGTGVDTSGPSSVAGALLVLTAIVTVHEFGHFVAAKAQGIHVTQFSIGFGPKIFSIQGKEVEYALRSIPLGGFVGFPDEDPESKYKPDDPDLLRNRSAPGRFVVMSAGIIANCIFAFSILFTQAATVGMGRTQMLPGVKIPKIISGSVAEAAGLQRGDIVVAVGDQPLTASRDTVNRLVQYIKDRPEKRIVFKVNRKGSLVDVPMVSELGQDGDGKIGAQLATYAQVKRVKANGPIDAAKKAGEEFGRMASMVGSGLLSIVTNFNQSKDAVSGPLAIVAAGADIARNDAASLMQFAAIVNVNLAMVNALPLPALDGGYIFLILIEALRGKRIDKIVEQTYMASGFLLLTGLGLFLVVRDVFNLGQGLF